MNRPEVYQKSVDVLAKAYVDGRLDKLDCAACAVGNLVAAGCGYKIIGYNKYLGSDGIVRTPDWLFIVREWNLNKEGVMEVNSTGYDKNELTRIERAFMYPPEHLTCEYDEQYHGLMAVLKVLDEIHEVTDQAVSIKSKSKFIQTWA